MKTYDLLMVIGLTLTSIGGVSFLVGFILFKIATR